MSRRYGNTGLGLALVKGVAEFRTESTPCGLATPQPR